MRFKIAATATVAVSVAAGEESGSKTLTEQRQLQEQEDRIQEQPVEAQKDAPEKVISNGLYSDFIHDRLLNPWEDTLQTPSDALGQYREPRNRPKSDDLDLGILAAKKTSSTTRKTKDDDERQTNSNRKIFDGLNSGMLSVVGSSLLDLKVMKKQQQQVESDNHRILQDDVDAPSSIDLDALEAAPIAYTFNMLCAQAASGVITLDCDTCQIDYGDASDPSADYSLFVDCSAPAQLLGAFQPTTDNLAQLCSWGFCQGGCEFGDDPARFQFEVQNCGWNSNMNFDDNIIETATPTPQLPDKPPSPKPTPDPTADSLFDDAPVESSTTDSDPTQSAPPQSAGFITMTSTTRSRAVVLLAIAAAFAFQILVA